jgi:vitamin B12 transporter
MSLALSGVPLHAPRSLRRLPVHAALCAVASGTLSLPALAQSAAPSGVLAPVVVTAARTAQPLTDVVSDVSLIDRDTLERFGNASLGDVLSTLPGVELSRNGGPTATTSLFVRGADTRHTVLLIDGVRVDSQSTGGAAWQALALEHIDRIEVLRGPAAAIYGSDAIGGVVQVFTRKGEAGFHPSLGVGLGSHGTRTASAQVSGAQGAWDYALGLTRETSNGFNIQPTGNPDRDGYRKTNGLARVGLQANPDHRLEALWTSSEANTGYDAFASKVDDRALQDLRTLALSWQARWSDVWSSRVQFTRGLDRYETTPSAYVTDTQVDTWLWHHQWQLGAHQLTAALERRQDRLLNGSTTPQLNDRSQNAVALGYGFKQGDHTVQANLRHDDDSEFGRHTTGSLAYALALAPHWRLTASAGTAFRAPTLFHRFSIYGTPSLRPEESRNLELALKYAAQGDSVSVTAYRNRLTNLINYVSGPGDCANGVGAFPGCYGNVGKATLQGLTLAATTRVAAGVPGGVGLNASLDLQNPRDDTTGRTLARRSKRVAKLGADLRVAGWTLGAETQWHSSRFDSASSTARLGGYGVVNLSASTQIAPQWTLVAKLDNLGDKDYQTARGYATGGRTAYVGVNWAAR